MSTDDAADHKTAKGHDRCVAHDVDLLGLGPAIPHYLKPSTTGTSCDTPVPIVLFSGDVPFEIKNAGSSSSLDADDLAVNRKLTDGPFLPQLFMQESSEEASQAELLVPGPSSDATVSPLSPTT